MGGNALTVYTRRYTKKEYKKICKEVSELLTDRVSNYGEPIGGIKHHITTSYKNKKDFGDMDVLILKSSLQGNETILDVIRTIFDPVEIYKNGSVCSFDYKDFQIDFISVKDKYWETSKNYFSYNDLGNFIGRISYKMGFRFGDYGLKLVYLHEDGGKKFQKSISTDPAMIYEFLGFDYDRYLEGFDEVDDIFKYVVQSKYFNARIFDYDQLNHQNKTRNKKRKNYALFLEYIKTSDDVLPFDYEFRSKDYYVEKAEKFFNINISDEISRFKKLVDQEKRASEKFNGRHIMERYGFQGKELGESIKKFKNYMDSGVPSLNDDEKKVLYNRFILDNSLEQIFEVFNRANNLN